MVPFCCGTAFGAVLLAALVLVGGHVFLEIADGRLASI
jgi:hypothetical protein